MLDLESAIKHCEEVAEKSEEAAKTFGDKDDCNMKDDCQECAKEHRQLAEWLRELQGYKADRVCCEFCKYQGRLEYERPCSLCKHNFKDMFEREVKADG